MRLGTWAAIAVLCFAGCKCNDSSDDPDAAAGDGDGDGDGESGASGDGDGDASSAAGASGSHSQTGEGTACLVSGAEAQISSQQVDKIDLVFMVDNSASMAEEQASLRAEFPRLINTLTTGDIDGDGEQDFAPARDLHLAVVTSDLGAPGVPDLPGCSNLGDDGVFHNQASPDVMGCSASTFSPRFLSFVADVNDPAQTATDFACLASVGIQGCGMEQQLEALLKSVWPSNDTRIQFTADPMGFGMSGQAGPSAPNGNVLRSDPNQGLSLVALVVVTDDDDCSVTDSSLFAPSLPDSDPRSMQGLNTRCFFEGMRPEPNGLLDVTRYINGFKALREGNENLVVFAGIIGVPPDLVTQEQLEAVDFSNPAASDAFYDGVLAAPAMQATLDDQGTSDPADDTMVPSCNTQGGRAFPPRRIVEVAKGFGPNAVIQSICQSDLSGAMDVIIRKISTQLGATCLPRPLKRDVDGKTACDVIWQLPTPGLAPAATPTTCSALPFLSPTSPSIGIGGGVRCVVSQLAVVDGALKPSQTEDDGWFYDDFSDELSRCATEPRQRIAFTPGAKPPPGVTVTLRCDEAIAETDDEDAQCALGPQRVRAHDVGKPCLPASIPEGGFDESQGYVETVNDSCNDGACIVYHLGGDPTEGCVPSETTSCASPQDIEARVYCSCRCAAPDGADECQCANGFSCVDVLEGSAETSGGYCVRNATTAL